MNKIPTIPDAFSYMLLEFNDLSEGLPPLEKIKGKLLKLKEDAKINNELNVRQREAITARVDNYLNGTYGTSKREEHFGHGKNETKK